MDYQIVTLDTFFIAGIAVRTTNENGRSQHDIGALWEQIFNGKIITHIPDKLSNNVYCVYTDYEQDANGFYTTIIGCQVASLQNLPTGIMGKVIPKVTYQLYSATGKLPESVLAVWRHIWQTPIERAYTADFDVYDFAVKTSDGATVKTYLSVRS
jgi:predicted transcriptional regulator YdeE